MSLLGNLNRAYTLYSVARAKVNRLDIIFSVNNNEDSVVIPIVPSKLPEIDVPQQNDTFKAITGDLNIIGPMGLRSFTLTSFFPVNKKYPYRRAGSLSNGTQYVDFFNKYRAALVPLRVVMAYNDGSELLNMACTIDDFRYYLDAANDISYSLSCREYKFVEDEDDV